MIKKDWYNHIAQFRCGAYEDATEDVQKAWICFVDRILEKVNKKWKNQLFKANKFLSEVVTSSDEAYALLVSGKEMDKWITDDMTARGRKQKKQKKPEEPPIYSIDHAAASAKQPFDERKDDEDDEEANKDDEEDAQAPIEDDVDDEGMDGGSASATSSLEFTKELTDYYGLFQVISQKRTTEDEGSSWEQGYKEAVSSYVFSKASQSSQGLSTASVYSSVDEPEDAQIELKGGPIEFERWNI